MTVSRQVRRPLNRCPSPTARTHSWPIFNRPGSFFATLTGDTSGVRHPGQRRHRGATEHLEGQPGLIVTNREFGERLVDHALGLDFELAQFSWGKALDLDEIQKQLETHPRPGMALVPTHSKISAGMLNDLAALAFCAKHEVKLCIRYISSIGTTPVNLEELLCVVCQWKGIAIISGTGDGFLRPAIESEHPKGCRDCGSLCPEPGRGVYHSSNLVHALHAAVKRVECGPNGFRSSWRFQSGCGRGCVNLVLNLSQRTSKPRRQW